MWLTQLKATRHTTECPRMSDLWPRRVIIAIFFRAAGKRFFFSVYRGWEVSQRERKVGWVLKKGGEGREFLFLFPFPLPPASSAKLDFRSGWLIEPLFLSALNISCVQSPYLISKQREIGASTNLSGHAPIPSHFPCELSWTTIRAKTSARASFQNDCPCTILNCCTSFVITTIRSKA